MHHKIYKGIYDERLVGLYHDKFVYYDRETGYIIERKYWKKPTKKELEEIKKKFGDLEKKVREFRII